MSNGVSLSLVLAPPPALGEGLGGGVFAETLRELRNSWYAPPLADTRVSWPFLSLPRPLFPSLRTRTARHERRPIDAVRMAYSLQPLSGSV